MLLSHVQKAHRFAIGVSHWNLRSGPILTKFFSTSLPRHNESDHVVISGIAGKFGNSRNYEQFRRKLFNNAPVGGKVLDLNKFDAGFFSVASPESVEPVHRVLLETCFEALIDAGLTPEALGGKAVGVFSSANGAADLIKSHLPQVTAEAGKGEQLEGDNLLALENAISAVTSGKYPVAIVTGTSQGPSALAVVVQKGSEANRSYVRVSQSSSKDTQVPKGVLVDVAKALVAIQNNIAPAQGAGELGVPKVEDGTLKLGGENSQLILKSCPPSKDTESLQSKFSIIVPVSARSRPGVSQVINEVYPNASDPEYRSLVQGVFASQIPGHTARAFGIIKPGQRNGKFNPKFVNTPQRRPLWCIFPGMGCQWPAMGKDMMKVDLFAESVLKSKAILKDLGHDLDDILKAGNRAMFDSLTSAFISIGTMIIALIDCLKALKIQPDGLIGHSAGEISAGYADGALTAEQAIRLYEARGRAFAECHKEEGAMAAVGLSWANVQRKLPPGVSAACSNAANNVSVSGPKDKIMKLIDDLDNEGIFAAQVNTCRTAPHCPAAVAPSEKMLGYYEEIVGNSAKPRSTRWVSTSVVKGSPEAAEDDGLASAAYFSRNARVPVRFYEAVKTIPANAIVVEVAPKKALAAVIKPTIKPSCTLMSLMDELAADHVEHFLEQLGTMYTCGVDMDFRGLYPHVPSPVSSATASIGHLASWDHSKSWPEEKKE